MRGQTETAIVVVAKAPQVGRVKTRLCPPLTYEQAAALHSGFLLDTIEIALSVSNCRVLAVCPSQADADELGQLLPDSVGYLVQSGQGLTAALHDSFATNLKAGYQKVLCISSDNPTLPTAYLEQAIRGLDFHDLVLGPSEDGGYYLVGAKKVYPFLFEEMIWSTSAVLSETIRRADQANLNSFLLPQWYDLDTGNELDRFRAELPLNGSEAPHTRRVLANLSNDLPVSNQNDYILASADKDCEGQPGYNQ